MRLGHIRSRLIPGDLQPFKYFPDQIGLHFIVSGIKNHRIQILPYQSSNSRRYSKLGSLGFSSFCLFIFSGCQSGIVFVAHPVMDQIPDPADIPRLCCHLLNFIDLYTEAISFGIAS
jgi:hypothetical protein